MRSKMIKVIPIKIIIMNINDRIENLGLNVRFSSFEARTSEKVFMSFSSLLLVFRCEGISSTS